MYHVMGFYHEMRRFDRDEHIEIHWENVIRGYSKYFDKLSPEGTQFHFMPYDIDSVMHYGSHAYSKHPASGIGRTITVVEHPGKDIPQINGLSDMDIRKLNLLYRCSDVTEGWSSWSPYSLCDKLCMKMRQRFCYSPTGEDACFNEFEHSQYENTECNEQECSIDGSWSRWTSWSECDANCGFGNETRHRECNDPAPRMRGRSCRGNQEDKKMCKFGSCNKGRFDCEFDNDGWCSWQTDGRWRIVRSSPNNLIGPTHDVSFLIGNYLQISADSTVGSVSSTVIPKSIACLSFYVWKSTTTEQLKVVATLENNQEVIFNVARDVGLNEWHEVRISLIQKQLIKLTFISDMRNSRTNSFIAIDDVFFNNKECPKETTTHPTISSTKNTKPSPPATPTTINTITSNLYRPTTTLTTTMTTTTTTPKQTKTTSTTTSTGSETVTTLTTRRATTQQVPTTTSTTKRTKTTIVVATVTLTTQKVPSSTTLGKTSTTTTTTTVVTTSPRLTYEATTQQDKSSTKPLTTSPSTTRRVQTSTAPATVSKSRIPIITKPKIMEPTTPIEITSPKEQTPVKPSIAGTPSNTVVVGANTKQPVNEKQNSTPTIDQNKSRNEREKTLLGTTTYFEKDRADNGDNYDKFVTDDHREKLEVHNSSSTKPPTAIVELLLIAVITNYFFQFCLGKHF